MWHQYHLRYTKTCKHSRLQVSHQAIRLAPRVGLEPTTTRLTAECSTIELSRKEGSASLNFEEPSVLPLVKHFSYTLSSSLKNLGFSIRQNLLYTHLLKVIPSKPNTKLRIIHLQDFLQTISGLLWSSFRSISTCQLNISLCLHPRPIYLVLSKGPSSYDSDISS